MQSIRRVWYMLFKRNKGISEVVDITVDEEHYRRVDMWKAIYSGNYKPWITEKVSTINNASKTRKRHVLNMANVSVEELSKLIFNEKVEINIDNEEYNENIVNVLSNNRFYKIFTEKIEQALALGGLMLKAHPKEQDDGSYKLSISYVTPDSFIPLSWENGVINEAAFLTTTRKKDKLYCLFEFHEWELKANDDNELVKVLKIRNELYEGDANATDNIKEVPLETLYPDLKPVVFVENLTQPLFQYIRPAKANNFNLQSPLGISVFANAIDTLYAIDTAFDSFVREFRLGKRRILVPSSAVRTAVDPQTGEMHRYFDADDEVYEAFNFSNPDDQKIQDNTVSLRVEEHIAAINALLDIYAMQIGFSGGTFNFDGKSVKTATEIVSENSKTYHTIKANQDIIEEALKKFIKTLGEVAELYDIFNVPETEEGKEININMYWDDSVVKDKYTDSEFYTKLLNAKVISKRFLLKQVLEMTDEQIDEIFKEIGEENESRTPDLSAILGDEEL